MSPKLKFRKKIRPKDGIVLQDLANAIILDVKPTKGCTTQVDNVPVVSNKKDINHLYNHIGTDIWFYIAEYISPEDVCSFALICQQTSFVVSSAKFWTCLYKRYYNKKKDLPDNLDFHCLKNVRSLRSKVIRALFFVYPPFVERIKLGYDVSSVNGFKYINSWHKKESNIWLFCYKLWNCTVSKNPRRNLQESDSDEEDFLKKALYKLDNVFENPHEGISLLVIFSKRFIPFPVFHGNQFILHSTRQLLSSDLRSTNLQIEFIPAGRMNYVSVDVVYPGALKYKVIPWWHPDYKIFLYNEKSLLSC